jgi:hypothetical protein
MGSPPNRWHGREGHRVRRRIYRWTDLSKSTRHTINRLVAEKHREDAARRCVNRAWLPVRKGATE